MQQAGQNYLAFDELPEKLVPAVNRLYNEMLIRNVDPLTIRTQVRALEKGITIRMVGEKN